MKKILNLLVALVFALPIFAQTTLYLNTGGSSFWNQDDAKFMVWYWNSGGSTSGASDFMTVVSGSSDIYQTTISLSSSDIAGVIFLRLNSNTTSFDWDSSDIWNRTDDETPGSYNCFTVTSWGSDYSTGSWSTYGSGGTTTTDPDTGGTTGGTTDDTTIDGPDSAVPDQCGDVMLQGFYWDSHSSTTYGTTKWSDLMTQTSEITSYFDMVWLPPSASSEGGLGYHPRQWSNQSSDLGTSTQLKTLISQLHDGGAKVIADVVVNHRANSTSWCDFLGDNFGDYGTYQFTTDHIVKDDEMNYDSNAGDCYGAATGAYDTGEQYTSARDLDHTSAYVQEAVIAYLKWLRTEMEYDGFRYDVAKGFTASYFNTYNQAARPEFSVGEYYDGDASTLKWWIESTGYNSLAFDFATKFSGFNQGIASDNYSALQGCGLLGAGYSKYAVTFIDNHDTFERDDNDNDFQAIGSSEKILHANAFILSMPGIPCVFYPHWYTYKEDIKPMIEARRAAGVHSESSVTDEYTAYNRYECTVQGTNGYLILRIGSGSDYNTVPTGYTKVASGTNYAILIQSELADAIEPVMIISPVGGKYIGGTTVEITATQDATIYYTLDGTEPTTSSTKYTSPISITTNNTVLKSFATNGTTSCAVQTNTYVTEEEPRTEPIVVKLYKPDTWNSVYMWAWDDDGNQLFPTTSGATWPGEAINDDGDGWWSYSFDLTVNTVNLVFNEGLSSGDQTGDVIGIEDSTCFEYTGSNMEPNAVDCGADVAVDNTYVQNSVILYPNPAENQFTVTASENISSLRVYNIAGQCVYSSANNSTSVNVNVSSWSQGLYLVRVTDVNNNITTAKFSKK